MMMRKQIKRWIQKHIGWDDPEFDSTDWAHPAWHRGALHGLHGAIRLVGNIVSGKETGVGAMYEDVDKLRQMVLGLKRRTESLNQDWEQQTADIRDERDSLKRERDSLRCDVERLTRELHETKWSGD